MTTTGALILPEKACKLAVFPPEPIATTALRSALVKPAATTAAAAVAEPALRGRSAVMEIVLASLIALAKSAAVMAVAGTAAVAVADTSALTAVVFLKPAETGYA